MTRALLITNPFAARADARAVTAILEILGRGGWNVDLKTISGPGDARRIAEESLGAGFDVLVSHGGDGTAMQVAAGIAGSGIALGVRVAARPGPRDRSRRRAARRWRALLRRRRGNRIRRRTDGRDGRARETALEARRVRRAGGTDPALGPQRSPFRHRRRYPARDPRGDAARVELRQAAARVSQSAPGSRSG